MHELSVRIHLNASSTFFCIYRRLSTQLTRRVDCINDPITAMALEFYAYRVFEDSMEQATRAGNFHQSLKDFLFRYYLLW